MAGSLFIPPPSAGNPIWANDNIWLDVKGGKQNTDEAVGTPPAMTGLPLGTLENLIGVRVSREGGGIDTNKVTVQAWVNNPSFGVGAFDPPAGLLSSNGRSGLQKTLPQGQDFTAPVTFHLPWFPTDAEASTNGGHICIAANVYDQGNPGDGAALGSGPIDLSNRHQAQRNIHIIAAAGFRAPISVPLFFFVPPAELLPPGTGEEVFIRAEPVAVDRVLTPVIREQLLTSERITLLGGEPTPGADLPGDCLDEPRERIRLRGGGKLALAKSEDEIHPSEEPPGQVFLDGQDGDGDGGGGAKNERKIVPQTGIALAITAHFEMLPDKPGAVHEFDIFQQSSDGKALGGMRVVLLQGLDWW